MGSEEVTAALPEWASTPCIMGIDEAGRGPVLGPMVYECLYCPRSYQDTLSTLSFADIKKKTTPVTLAPIAKPLAGKKLCKRSFKLVRRAAENKCLKRGVTEVVKRIRRGNKGICIIAGNISPIDIITHVPILCEEAEVPYFYVPLKEDLATAGNTKRPTCCVLVQMKPAKGELAKDELEKLKSDYDQVVTHVSELNSSLF